MRRTNFKALVKGICRGVLVLLSGYCLLVFWVVFSSQQSYYLANYLKLIFFVALIVAGFTGGMAARWEGWKHGGWIGGAVALAAVLVNVTLFPQLLSLSQVANRLLAGVFIGGAAAVCGVNFAFLQRRSRLSSEKNKNSPY